MSIEPRSLILHADDLGITSSVNQASFEALENQWVTSASVMVPTPCFSEVARFARATQNRFDLGIHLTFTSEWSRRPLSPCSNVRDVRSLVDRSGHFRKTVQDFLKYAKVSDIHTEARKQIEVCLKSGIRPTHLDCHMFSLYQRSDLVRLLKTLSFYYQLPVLLSGGRLFCLAATTQKDDWVKSYIEIITRLPKGLSEVVVHLGYNDQESRRLMGEATRWGASWRERDLDFVSSYFLPGFLKNQSIQLTNWRTLGRL
jgi:hypothetical protein